MIAKELEVPVIALFQCPSSRKLEAADKPPPVSPPSKNFSGKKFFWKREKKKGKKIPGNPLTRVRMVMFLTTTEYYGITEDENSQVYPGVGEISHLASTEMAHWRCKN